MMTSQTLSKLKTGLAAAVITAGLSGIAGAEDYSARAGLLAEAGSVAAGFAAVSTGKHDDALVEEKFGKFGPDVLSMAKKWAADADLKDSPPAFRRFLLFDYLTRGTDIIAAATNPESLIINTDASVEAVFGDHPQIVEWANKKMDEVVTTSESADLENYHVSVHPMIPPEAKAANCIACHASAEVDRPYPDGHKVLGYTFIAIPK